MFKREEPVRPSPTPSPSVVTPVVETRAPQHEGIRHAERDVVNIGKSVIIKGDLIGSEDLTIEGQVDGKIELKQNVLTIGPNGKIKAQIFAKAIIIHGEVTGNVTATEKVDIRDNGSVNGDVSAPRLSIADGAHFRGSIDMQRGTAKGAEPHAAASSAAEAKPAHPSAPVGGHSTPAGVVR